jgi:hypothetical protein
MNNESTPKVNYGRHCEERISATKQSFFYQQIASPAEKGGIALTDFFWHIAKNNKAESFSSK